MGTNEVAIIYFNVNYWKGGLKCNWLGPFCFCCNGLFRCSNVVRPVFVQLFFVQSISSNPIIVQDVYLNRLVIHCMYSLPSIITPQDIDSNWLEGQSFPPIAHTKIYLWYLLNKPDSIGKRQIQSDSGNQTVIINRFHLRHIVAVVCLLFVKLYGHVPFIFNGYRGLFRK